MLLRFSGHNNPLDALVYKKSRAAGLYRPEFSGRKASWFSSASCLILILKRALGAGAGAPRKLLLFLCGQRRNAADFVEELLDTSVRLACYKNWLMCRKTVVQGFASGIFNTLLFSTVGLSCSPISVHARRQPVGTVLSGRCFLQLLQIRPTKQLAEPASPSSQQTGWLRSPGPASFWRIGGSRCARRLSSGFSTPAALRF